MNDDATLIDEMISDHHAVEEIFQRIDTLPLGDGRLRTCVAEAADTLERHGELERRYLLPAVREHLAHGHALARQENEERTRIERLLNSLQGLVPTDELFETRLDSLMQAVRSHQAHLEEHLFPRLQDAVPAGRLHEWGDAARRIGQPS